MPRFFLNVCLIQLIALCGLRAEAKTPREVIPAKTDGQHVSAARMREIYEQVKTPHKYGVVIKDPHGRMVDSPSVFRHGKKWHMTYITFDGTGYETCLASSDNLIEWKQQDSAILPFGSIFFA